MAKRKKRPAKRRVARLPPEARAIIERQRVRFRAKFGRDPNGDEPVFFDAAIEESGPADPDAMLAELIAAMKKAKISSAKIQAVRRNGRVVSRNNWRFLSHEDRVAWQAALNEYERFRK